MQEKDTFRFMGIWTCHGRIGKHTLGGCGHVNLYVSKYRSLKPKTIDSRCRRCNKRRKFQPSRRDNRGGLRSIGFIWIPNSHNLEIEDGFEFMESAQRNRDLIHGKFTADTFTTFEQTSPGFFEPSRGGEE